MVYRYSPNRRAEHPKAHLKLFISVLQADGYSGCEGLYEGERVVEVACWAHVWRPFYELHLTGQAPLATEVLRRIARFYAVEEGIRGKPPDERARVRVRQARAGPVVEEMHAWFRTTLGAEQGRAGAEAQRQIWESARNLNEDGRVVAEELRQDAEILREAFEEMRQVRDEMRETREEARQLAEEVRQAAERSRVEAEALHREIQQQREELKAERRAAGWPSPPPLPDP